MSNLLKMLVILGSLLVMAGCGVHTNQVDITGYPYRYADFDYKYAWKAVATDNSLLIEGVMKNVRYAYIDSVVMRVNVLDKSGKVVAAASDFPMPQKSKEGDECFFSLKFKDVEPAPGDVFQFLVHYTGNEGDHHGGGVDWHSSFKVEALTGAAILPPKNPDKW